MHRAPIPLEALEMDSTIHLWLICSGVCGMDVVDIRRVGQLSPLAGQNRGSEEEKQSSNHYPSH